MKRFSIRALLVATALLCAALGKVSHFIQTNRTDWAREQAAIASGADHNVSIVASTCTAPEWLISWLPADQQEIYYRLTGLDLAATWASPEQVERCLVFEHINMIRLGVVEDANGLAHVLKRFRQLRVIYMGTHLDEEDAALFEVLQRELPHVQVVNTTVPRGK